MKSQTEVVIRTRLASPFQRIGARKAAVMSYPLPSVSSLDCVSGVGLHFHLAVCLE